MLKIGTLQFGLRHKGLARILSGLMVAVYLLTNASLSLAFTSAGTSGKISAGGFMDIDSDGDLLGDNWEIHHWGSTHPATRYE